MKILNRQQFLTMPPGTIYAAGKPHAYGEWIIKLDTLGTDWISQSLNWSSIDCSGSSELFDIANKMLNGGSHQASFDVTYREADYDNTHFVVLEDNDIRALIKTLESRIKCTPT